MGPWTFSLRLQKNRELCEDFLWIISSPVILLSWRSERFGKAAWRLSPGPRGSGSGGLGSSPADKGLHWVSGRKWRTPGGFSQIWSRCCTCLDLPEVHWLADQLVVLWQLLPGRQLDENLAELSPTGAAGRDLISIGQNDLTVVAWSSIKNALKWLVHHFLTDAIQTAAALYLSGYQRRSTGTPEKINLISFPQRKHTDSNKAPINTKTFSNV